MHLPGGVRDTKYGLHLNIITSFGDQDHVSEGDGQLLAKGSDRAQHERKPQTA